MKPKISVIIPVYKAYEYLERCFDSIINNGYDNLEIIPVNDGSPDNSYEIIEKYEKQYPNIFFPINQENQGIGAARNNALKKATGDYVMFIDNDDFIDEGYFNFFISNLDDDYDMILSGYRRVDDEKELFHVKLSDYPWSKYISIAPWGRLYKLEFLKENNIEFLITPIGEDVYFNLQANSLAKKIKITDYIGYNWYQNSRSVTNTITDKIKKIDCINLLNTHYNILLEKDVIKNNENILTVYFFLLIIQFLQWTSPNSSKKEIKQNYSMYLSWFKEKFPRYKKVKYFKTTKGDRLKIRLIILIMITTNRLNIGTLPVYMFSKIS